MIDNSQILSNMGNMLSFFFPLWPVVLLMGLGWRRRMLLGLVFGWVLMLGLWVITLFGSVRLTSFLLPEPWNTILFFATGAVLFAFLIVRSIAGRQVRV